MRLGWIRKGGEKMKRHPFRDEGGANSEGVQTYR